MSQLLATSQGQAPVPEVIGLGFSCIDDLLLLSEIPPPEGRATVLRRESHGGGMVATAMVAVSKLGGRAGLI
jgi:sugar/nucleoside kinase (ribokinase family)